MELALTANELQLLETRRALTNMGSRTGVDGLVRLANTLLQSMQYGTPLTDAMRVQQRALSHLALGRREGEKALAPWKPLCEELSRRFGRSEPELLALVGQIPGVSIDPGRDEIALAEPIGMPPIPPAG